MSYYVTMDFDLRLIDLKGLSKTIEPFQKEGEFDDIRIESFSSKGGDVHALTLDDYYRNYDEDAFNELCIAIAPFVEGHIYMRGETNEHWATYFDGKGNQVYQDGVIMYGFCSYKEFTEEYEKLLPEKLKEDLKSWWISRKV